MASIRVAFAIAMIFVVLSLCVEAYRKPPLNGSIFGKRSNAATDYETTNRALAAICEVASETCSSWYARQEYN